MEIWFLSCICHCCSLLCPWCLWLCKLNKRCFIHQFPVSHLHESIHARKFHVLTWPGEHLWWITWAIKWRHLCEQCTWNSIWGHSVIEAEIGNKKRACLLSVEKLNIRILQWKSGACVHENKLNPLLTDDKAFSKYCAVNLLSSGSW